MFSKALLLFTAFTFASSVLAQPHSRRDLHMRHAHHVKAAHSSPVEAANSSLRKSKRQSNKRCRKPSSSSTKVSVKSTDAPVNVAPQPLPTTEASIPSSSSTHKAQETTEVSTPSSSTHKAQTTTEAPEPTKSTVKPTSTQQEPEPKPTTTHEAPKPTTSTKKAEDPAPTKSSGGGKVPSFLAGTNTGQGTFYATGLTACGVTNNDNQLIAAVSQDLFDTFPGATANPNNNPVCGKKVTATYQGKSVTVTITDRCVACKITDLDFSPAAFNKLSDPDVGRISGMTWHFL